jgi:gamma-glutamyl:cysteine ligase YbdK (ATP-grasp superfamily)
VNTTTSNRLKLFQAFGIELEYMLVDRETLDVRSVADRVLASVAGKPTSDFESGAITWSNELALHVIELKGTLPTRDLVSLTASLQQGIADMQPFLAANNVCLLPTGMHPWMDPTRETQIWPHESSEIYQAYHRVFDCFTHGWANVQSVHLNLPFADDEQFAQLHAATRIILPILPALTASSPIIDGRRGNALDMRMQHVRAHCQRIPFLTGEMVPEPIFDEATYRQQIFAKLKELIGPHDQDEVFDANFLNARGAIARFDRGSVELRVMDVQEYPAADISICVAAIAALKTMVHEHWQCLDDQKSLSTAKLSQLLDEVSVGAETTVIKDGAYLRQFGVHEGTMTAGELWRHILLIAGDHEPLLRQFNPMLQPILKEGSLATRIMRAVGQDDRPEHLREVYQTLSDCLSQGKPFLP